MRKKLIYTFIAILVIAIASLSAAYFYRDWSSKQPKPAMSLQESSFDKLPGWADAKPRSSLHAFQISCKAFLKQRPDKPVGSQLIDLTAKDWRPACQAAVALKSDTNKEAKAFFEKWFVPVTFFDNKEVPGLFTGYYMPEIKGSIKRTAEYRVPLYGVPKDLIRVKLERFDRELRHHRNLSGRVHEQSLLPYYSRKEINEGAIKGKAPVIAWLDNAVNRQFLEIEGSGYIALNNGKKLFVGYAAENGAPYTPIASILIKMGVMTRDNASMQRIRTFFKKNPDKVDTVLNQNKSFVFFDILKKDGALGAQGVPLTPGYSLAVDRKWVPLGVPIWLATSRPTKDLKKDQSMQRLMIAQDTGGAIRGPVRGDVFWGSGEKAIHIAGHMKHPGYYWLLLPRHGLDRIEVK